MNHELLYFLSNELHKSLSENNLNDTYEIIKSFTIISDYIVEYYYRDYFTHNISWAIPSLDVINQLVEFFHDKGTVLEVAAGRGLWSKLLQLNNIDIIATDLFCSHHHQSSGSTVVEEDIKTFCSVEKLSYLDALKKYKTECLFLCWPPYNNSLAVNTLRCFEGKYLIYIGEGECGCNADDDFFDLLKENWKFIKIINNPRWEMIHDKVFIYERCD